MKERPSCPTGAPPRQTHSCSALRRNGSVTTLEPPLLFAGDLYVSAATPLPPRGQPVPWAPLVPEIRSHDLALVNLECPLTRRARAIDKAGPSLLGDPALAAMIVDGGFDGVTLANNHVLDAGADGVSDTIAACQGAGLSTAGAGMDLSAAEKPLIVEAGGLRVGVVACAEREFSIAGRRSPGAAPLDPWRTTELVRDAAQIADVVIVVLHGGNEFAAIPRPGLVAACRGLVAAGAHAVVCHHSHVAGPVEVFRGAPIFYGTGNFLFPDSSEPSRAGTWGTSSAWCCESTVCARFGFCPTTSARPGSQSVRSAGERKRGLLPGRCRRQQPCTTPSCSQPPGRRTARSSAATTCAWLSGSHLSSDASCATESGRLGDGRGNASLSSSTSSPAIPIVRRWN